MILNVTPVAAEMYGDSISTGQLTDHCRRNYAWFWRASSLLDRCHVIDVDV
jgi:hypothetical protein